MKYLTKIIIFTLPFTNSVAHAALATNAILNFDTPVIDSNGLVISGANFGIDFNGDGAIELIERTPLLQLNGLALGTTQTATTATPDIDTPWQFFAQPGVHSTVSPISILSDTGTGTVELDFSGWQVYWNDIVIDLGSNSWGSNPNGVAILNCSNDCSAGDTFSLFYTAEVDEGPFLGVRYRFGLDNAIFGAKLNEGFDSYSGETIEDLGIIATGTIGAVIPIPAAIWLFGSGLIGLVTFASQRKK